MIFCKSFLRVYPSEGPSFATLLQQRQLHHIHPKWSQSINIAYAHEIQHDLSKTSRANIFVTVESTHLIAINKLLQINRYTQLALAGSQNTKRFLHNPKHNGV